MFFSPTQNNDLISVEVMSAFFSDNCTRFGAEKLISLEITPHKSMAGNKLIGYEPEFLMGGKRQKLKIWGKTIDKKIFEFCRYLSTTEVYRNTPKYLWYFDSLNFGLAEDAGGIVIRSLEKDGDFWIKNAGNLGVLLANFQKIEIPDNLLDIRTGEEEEGFIKNSLDIISRYSEEEGPVYESIADKYLSGLANINDKLAFSHFDFQPSNIFLNKLNSFVLVDYDLAKKFYPAMDAANFITHIQVMLNFHHPKEFTAKIEDLFLESYLSELGMERSRSIEHINLFKLRAAIDIAQVTANVFGRPNENSRKVFNLLAELR